MISSLVSCKSENDKNAALSKKNVEYYSHVWEVAINEGRINILDSAYVDDAVIHAIPEVKGKANARAFYENYVTGFSDRKFIVKEIFADGDKLVLFDTLTRYSWPSFISSVPIAMSKPAESFLITSSGHTV
mgnify:CR=1 FL=1